MHICNNERWFTNITRFEYKIETAEKSRTINVIGGGTYQIPVTAGDGTVNTLELSEVAYVPTAACNLLSLSLLTKKGKIRGTRDKDAVIILTKEGEFVGRALKDNRLYHLNVIKPSPPIDEPPSLKAFSVIDLGDEVWKWHRRLGHLSWQGMRNLLKVSIGCTLTDEQLRRHLRVVCPVCAVTKALVKVPRDPARRRAERIGDLFHADVWGPYSVPGYDG